LFEKQTTFGINNQVCCKPSIAKMKIANIIFLMALVFPFASGLRGGAMNDPRGVSLQIVAFVL
jgi:hypothetical protein